MGQDATITRLEDLLTAMHAACSTWEPKDPLVTQRGRSFADQPASGPSAYGGAVAHALEAGAAGSSRVEIDIEGAENFGLDALDETRAMGGSTDCDSPSASVGEQRD
jgi:hypothetical protein